MSVGSGGVANFVYTTNAVAKGVAAVINAGRSVVTDLFDVYWELFSSGEQGLWYDLNDDSTIFQDSAGTTLATWGDPVGRVNDKSGNGNNAIQSTSGARMIRGRMPKRGRVNLLVSTGNLNGTGWTRNQVTVLPSTIVAPDGTTTADRIYPNSSGTAASRFIFQRAVNASSISVSTITLAPAGKSAVVFYGADGSTIAGYVNLTTGVASSVAGGYTITTTSKPNSFYEIVITSPAVADAYLLFAAVDAVGALTITANGTDGIAAWRPQLELGSTTTAYQHVIDSLGFNITESGQPSCGYLSFNGSNQWMQTASAVNFSATDEMSVFAGVLKRAAAGAFGAVLEHNISTVPPGSFNVFAPGGIAGSTDNYSFVTRGQGVTVSTGFDAVTFAPPHYAALSSVMDNGAATRALQVLPRVNGAIPTLNAGGAAATGAGNYANAVTYFGARAGTSLFFNGLMFSVIIRGALTSGEPLTGAEKYVASCTPTVNL